MRSTSWTPTVQPELALAPAFKQYLKGSFSSASFAGLFDQRLRRDHGTVY
jgi:hypothetical protein